MAIDFHNISRYDKHPDMKFMRESKYKNGTCNFNVFATVHCVVDGSRLCLGAILATRADFKVEMVLKLLDKCEENRVRINMLTLDREFYTREVMSLLNRREIQFLMPADKRKAVSRHTITSSDRVSEEFTLIIRKAKNATDAAKVATGEGNKEDEPGVPRVCHQHSGGCHPRRSGRVCRAVQEALGNRDRVQVLREGKAQGRQQERVGSDTAHVLSLPSV